MFDIILLRSFCSFVDDNDHYQHDFNSTNWFAKVKEKSCFLLSFLEYYFFIRLPVPTLAETSKKYLKTVAPLLNNDEFNETKKVCVTEI